MAVPTADASPPADSPAGLLHASPYDLNRIPGNLRVGRNDRQLFRQGLCHEYSVERVLVVGGQLVDPYGVFQLHGKAFHGVQCKPRDDEVLRLLRDAQLASLDLDDQLPGTRGTRS